MDESIPEEEKPVALVDLDGSCADYDRAMERELSAIASPGEERVSRGDKAPPWMRARVELVRARPGFWRNLEPIEEGLQVISLMQELKYHVHVLTKGPRDEPQAWAEKLEWCRAQRLMDRPEISITTNKGLTYGRVLFDDWPRYIVPWLKYRPRGQVLMMDQPWNRDFEHPQVLRVLQRRYSSPTDVVQSLARVADALERAKA